jgi:TolA-binding protein
MDCERFDKITIELLYGELDKISEAAALRHLHHCTRCRDIWGHLKATRELSEIPMEEPPPDLFDSILLAERNAHNHLTTRERFSRAISILAGYAMRPQIAMAAILLLMIGSSLMFIRTSPTDAGKISVTEQGTPHAETPEAAPPLSAPLMFEKVGSPSDFNDVEDDDAPDTSSKGADPGEDGSRRAYAEAMSAYQDGRYAEAERLFSELASGGGAQAPSAALHEGHAARNGSGCGTAAALYDAIAARYSGSTVGSEASWHAASCYRALGQDRRAAAHYEGLMKQSAYASRAKQALDELSPRLAVTVQDTGDGEPKPAASATSALTMPASKSKLNPHSAAEPPSSRAADNEETSNQKEPKTAPSPESDLKTKSTVNSN